MDTPERQIFELKNRLRELQIEVDSVSAQNSRLSKENIELKQEINEKSRECNIGRGIKTELQLQLFKTESDRDDLESSLQRLKIRYNKLYDDLIVKKNINSVVIRDRNSMDSNNSDRKTIRVTIDRYDMKLDLANASIETLQTKLNEAYDVIDGLEFELDYMNILELENTKIREENRELKCKLKIENNIGSDLAALKIESSREQSTDL